mgnify:FL=1
MTEFQQQFSKRLREIRISSGISQEEFAEAVGVAPKTVSYWENGHNAISFNKLPVMANALGIPIYKLFVFTDSLTKNDNQDIIEFLSSMTEKERNTVLAVIKAILMLK